MQWYRNSNTEYFWGILNHDRVLVIVSVALRAAEQILKSVLTAEGGEQEA